MHDLYHCQQNGNHRLPPSAPSTYIPPVLDSTAGSLTAASQCTHVLPARHRPGTCAGDKPPDPPDPRHVYHAAQGPPTQQHACKCSTNCHHSTATGVCRARDRCRSSDYAQLHRPGRPLPCLHAGRIPDLRSTSSTADVDSACATLVCLPPVEPALCSHLSSAHSTQLLLPGHADLCACLQLLCTQQTMPPCLRISSEATLHCSAAAQQQLTLHCSCCYASCCCATDSACRIGLLLSHSVCCKGCSAVACPCSTCLGTRPESLLPCSALLTSQTTQTTRPVHIHRLLKQRYHLAIVRCHMQLQAAELRHLAAASRWRRHAHGT